MAFVVSPTVFPASEHDGGSSLTSIMDILLLICHIGLKVQKISAIGPSLKTIVYKGKVLLSEKPMCKPKPTMIY